MTNETNVQEYTIEKSSDAIHFSAAGKMAPGSLNSNNGNYSFTDWLTGAIPPVIYYRVKSSGINTPDVFSEILQVKPSPSTAGLLITPNPAPNPLRWRLQASTKAISPSA